jgi:2-polyprenyl-6-hydroxyphenyl methylase/3-demethylubiquinone-9 3-methyltransferase
VSETANVDSTELQKFDAMAASWWDPEGDFKPLHDLNPVRLQFIMDHARVADARVVDVGCGAGLLSEAMAEAGAKVARLHLHESGLEVDYRRVSVEALAEKEAGSFDTVTCLEMLEHVPDPESVVQSCQRLLKPGGHCVFSTINRTPKAFAVAIAGAEYVLRLLPRGTHEYGSFIRPSELLRVARRAGLELLDLKGLGYNPFSGNASLISDVGVNYIASFVKSA